MASSLAMKTAFVSKVHLASKARPQHRAAVQCVASHENEAATSRRFALGLFATGAAGAVLSMAGPAQAVKIASQESTGGLGQEGGGKGSMPKNASAASMSSFNMEGTKKRGISPKRKAAVLAKAKAKALSKADK